MSTPIFAYEALLYSFSLPCRITGNNKGFGKCPMSGHSSFATLQGITIASSRSADLIKSESSENQRRGVRGS